MKKYDYLLFDLDGTITDPGAGITNSVEYSLNKFGISVDDKKDLYKFIGPPLYESFEKYYGFTKEQSQTAVAYYREYFKDKGIYENFLYAEIDDILSLLELSHKALIIATSKPEIFAEQILTHFNIRQYFSFVAGAALDGSRSEKADVISYALSSCGITDKNSVLMIGDRKHDIIGAKKNGIDAMGVLYGYGSRQELLEAKSDYIIEFVQDLKCLI